MRRNWRRGEGPASGETVDICLELPAPVAALVAEAGLTPRLAIRADIDESGQFAPRWVVADQQRLLVIAPDEPPRVLLDVPLAHVGVWHVRQGVGTKRLCATFAGDDHLVARYTNAEADRFARARRLLEQWSRGEDDARPAASQADARQCPRCKRPLPEGSQVCRRCFSRRRALVRLYRYVRPHRVKLACTLGLMLLGTALSLTMPQLTGLLFDRVLAPGRIGGGREAGRLVAWLVTAPTRSGALLQIVGLMAAFQFASAAVATVRGRIGAWLAYHVVHDVRHQLYSHLQELSLRYFDKRQSGAIMARVTNDTRAMQGFLIDGFQLLVINTLTLVVVGGLLLAEDWRLALLILIPLPPTAALASLFWRRVRVFYARLWQRWERLTATLHDSLSGIRVVKAFAAEEREIARFERDSRRTAEAGAHANQLRATLTPWLGFLSTSSSLLIWGYGGWRVICGQLSPGQLMQFMAYLFMVYGPIQWMSDLFNWFQETLAASERVWEVLDEQTDMPPPAEPVRPEHIAGRFTFDRVTFGYEPHEPVLHEVQLDVAPGEMIGLVGHSGAGKSTLINLVCRFYDVNEGALLLDGVDIRQLDLREYRRHIGIVPQDSYLFNGSVWDNLTYGAPDAGPEEVFAAAKAANAHDFIVGLPDGYDTVVGEHGHRLSGGERQRVSIARAILHNPRVLILDEATASVDTKTERDIQQALERLVAGRTTFAIAHRLSTLRNADRLVVIEKGRVVETGTHDELMAKEGGVFRTLVEMQTDLNRITYVGG
jgi:ATP-binding cassette subfamily B protein